MKKIRTNLSALFVGAFFGSMLFALGGCVKQEASKANVLVNPPTATTTISVADAEIVAAQKIIETVPTAATGYNKIAVAYIRRARESGDFSLNANAQTAVGRALEIEPRNYDAQKLKASLLLTFHRFAEALESGAQLQKTNPRDAFIYGVLTDANVELGNYKEAIDAAQKMVDTKSNMESYARVAHVRSLHGDSGGAIKAMMTAAKTADRFDKEAQSRCLTYLVDQRRLALLWADQDTKLDEALAIATREHQTRKGRFHRRHLRLVSLQKGRLSGGENSD